MHVLNLMISTIERSTLQKSLPLRRLFDVAVGNDPVETRPSSLILYFRTSELFKRNSAASTLPKISRMAGTYGITRLGTPDLVISERDWRIPMVFSTS